MTSTMFMAGAVVLTAYVMIPKRWRARIAAYPGVADVASSAYVVNTYAATGTVAGLSVAVFAALGLTLSIRALRHMYGTEELSVLRPDGVRSTSLKDLAAGALTQCVHWAKSTFRALFTKNDVAPPPSLEWRWIKTSESSFVPTHNN